jgi:hypothetical protein
VTAAVLERSSPDGRPPTLRHSCDVFVIP